MVVVLLIVFWVYILGSASEPSTGFRFWRNIFSRQWRFPHFFYLKFLTQICEISLFYALLVFVFFYSLDKLHELTRAVGMRCMQVCGPLVIYKSEIMLLIEWMGLCFKPQAFSYLSSWNTVVGKHVDSAWYEYYAGSVYRNLLQKPKHGRVRIKMATVSLTNVSVVVYCF